MKEKPEQVTDERPGEHRQAHTPRPRPEECITVCRGTWVRCQSSSLENMNSNPKVRVQSLPQLFLPTCPFSHCPLPVSSLSQSWACTTDPEHTTSPFFVSERTATQSPDYSLSPRAGDPNEPERAHLLARTRETQGTGRGDGALLLSLCTLHTH